MIFYLMVVVSLLGILLTFSSLLTNSLSCFGKKYRLATALIGANFLHQLWLGINSLYLFYPVDVSVWSLARDIGVIVWYASVYYDGSFNNLKLNLRPEENINV